MSQDLITDRLREVLGDYLQVHPLSPSSLRTTLTCLRSFETWLGESGEEFESDVDRIAAWVKQLCRKKRSRKTIQIYKDAVLALVTHATPEGQPRPRVTLSKRLRSDNLEAIAKEYVLARQLCKKERERLASHVRRFDSWLADRSKCFEEETETTRLNEWLTELSEIHAPATVNGYRQSIIRLLRFATPDGEPLPRADRVRRQREPSKHKPAFTKEELRRLIAAAPKFKPESNRVRGRGAIRDTVPHFMPDGTLWSIWWEAFVRIGYESGQYLSDLRSLQWDQLAPDGSIYFIRHKTGRPITFRLSERAINAAREIGHKTLILPWEWNLEAYFPRCWKAFIKSVDGVRVLGAKSIRRSAITYTYVEQGELAARTLAGHSSFATTASHYIDWSIAKRPTFHPPSLEDV